MDSKGRENKNNCKNCIWYDDTLHKCIQDKCLYNRIKTTAISSRDLNEKGDNVKWI